MPKASLSKDEVKAMLILACERIIAAEPMLSQADRDLGDGDHGMGMERGMKAAIEKLNASEVESIRKGLLDRRHGHDEQHGRRQRCDLWHLLPQWRQSLLDGFRILRCRRTRSF